MKLNTLILSLLSAMLITGCLGPVKPPQTNTYVLNTLPYQTPMKASYRKTLLVLQPETQPAYNTTQMVYTIKPHQLAYFGQNQWAETPSQMLLPLIVQTLQNTHHYHAIVSPPYVGRYDYLLNTQILELQQDFAHNPSRVSLRVSAVLTKVSTNSVIATKQFEIQVPITQRTPYAGVLAANEATARFLEKLAYFCLNHR